MKIFSIVKYLLFIPLMTSLVFTEFALAQGEVESHVEGIENSQPSSSRQAGDTQSQPNSPHNSALGQVINEFFLKPFIHLFAYIAIPVAPIAYHGLGLPNSKDVPSPTPNFWQFSFAQNFGQSYTSRKFSLGYQMESLRFEAHSDKVSEDDFTATFNTLQASVIPNWNRVFKTGVSMGIRELAYLNTQRHSHSINGISLGFPTTLHFKGSSIGLIYVPQLVFYATNVSVSETKFGVTYLATSSLNLELAINFKDLQESENDLTFITFGIDYLF
jgi:hypothetical protein